MHISPPGRLPLLMIALAALAVTGCGVGEQSPADRAKACSAVADVVAPVGLSGTPGQDQALTTADELDPLLPSLRDATAHDAAVKLHQQLHAYEVALRKGTGRETAALERSREEARRLAEACGLEVSQLVR